MIHSVCMIGFRFALWLSYLPFRLLKPKRKIVYCSRQGNQPSMDFALLQQAIEKADPTVLQVTLCKTMGKGLKGKFSYGLHLFVQMYHLATAKAAVLDGYCIPACLLKHHKSLKIYQLWHALGLLKNFGYAAVGNQEGSSVSTARIMRMHRGYHKILCSSPHVIEGLSACYDAPVDKFLPIGIPRIDFLVNPAMQDKTKEQLLKTIPALSAEKPIVLYAPTFRKGKGLDIDHLAKGMDLDCFHLVVKEHNGTQWLFTQAGKTSISIPFSGLEWLAAADFVITDYSAIVFEAMTAQKPVILYCFDKEDYGISRGFSIPYDSIPAPQCTTPRQVMDTLLHYPYQPDKTAAFLDYHVTQRQGNCTETLCRIILEDFSK